MSDKKEEYVGIKKVEIDYSDNSIGRVKSIEFQEGSVTKVDTMASIIKTINNDLRRTWDNKSSFAVDRGELDEQMIRGHPGLGEPTNE